MSPTRLQTRRSRIARLGGGPRTGAALVALTVLSALAGCSGVGAELPFTAPPPYTDTGAELDGTDLQTDHLAGLQATEAFRSNATFVLRGPDQHVEISRRAAVDRGSDRRLETTRFDHAANDGAGLLVSIYTAGNDTYRRVVVDTDRHRIERYDTTHDPAIDGLLAVEPVDRTEAAHVGLVAAIVDDANWTQRGVERYDGGWVTRYEAIGVEQFSRAASTVTAAGQAESASRLGSTALDVTSIEATLLVSPDGVVRRFHLRVVGETAERPIELTLSVTTSGSDTTAVAPPTWLDEARTRTAG